MVTSQRDGQVVSLLRSPPHAAMEMFFSGIRYEMVGMVDSDHLEILPRIHNLLVHQDMNQMLIVMGNILSQLMLSKNDITAPEHNKNIPRLVCSGFKRVRLAHQCGKSKRACFAQLISLSRRDLERHLNPVRFQTFDARCLDLLLHFRIFRISIGTVALSEIGQPRLKTNSARKRFHESNKEKRATLMFLVRFLTSARN